MHDQEQLKHHMDSRLNKNKTILENVTVANAFQLEAARATPALCRNNYDAMPSLMLPNLSIAV